MEKVKEKQHPLNDPQVQLMSALEFTVEDLQANREGYLTKTQRSKFNQDRKMLRMYLLLVLFVAAPIATLWAINDGIHLHDTLNSRVAIVTVIWIVAFGIAIYIWLDKQKID